jgi:hypothetical protein
MTIKRWKLTVNDATKIWDTKPNERWSEIEAFVINRGGYAKLEYCEAVDANDIKGLLEWKVYAEIEG